jgi:hypothetical protein
LLQNPRDPGRDVDGTARIVEQRCALRTEQVLVMIDCGRDLLGIAGDAQSRECNCQPSP